jgi:branched-chain amino acid aminotransferase
MGRELRSFLVTARGLRERDVPAEATTVHEVLEGHPTGVYTALRTYGGDRYLELDAHLDRTDRSMELSGWPAGANRVDRERVRRGLQAVTVGSTGDLVVRLDVLPPDAPLAEARRESAETDGRTVLSTAPLQPVPAEFLEHGVRLAVARDLHRASPLIKTADFALERRPFPLGTRECYDHLLLDARDRVLEATSANFHALVDGRLRTAREGVLEGITRALVLELARSLELVVEERAVLLAELSRATEAFLTSSTRGIVPVVGVEDVVVGDGRPGPRTRALRTALEAHALAESRPAWPV